jgi:signal transduction histidine kinase
MIDTQAVPGPSATNNLVRVQCIAVGAAGVVFGALAVGPFLAQGWYPTPLLAASAWLSAFALPVVLALVSGWAPRRVLHGIVALEAACFIVICVFWYLFPGPLPEGAEIPWMITYTGLPAVAVATFASPRLAWTFTIIASILSGLVRFRTTTETTPVLVGVADGLFSLLLVSVFVALTLTARAGAARVDEATLLTRQAEARRAARVSRRQERLRIDALVHDSVISTLLMAGLGRSPLPVVAEHAAKTLRQLDALHVPPVQPVVLVSDIVLRLTRLAGQVAPDAVVRVDDPAHPGGGVVVERTVPAVAVAAMIGATGEALRNSVASAAGAPGPSRTARRVRRTVTLLTTVDGCQVTVSDDGVGFDPAAVPPERLGISQSILGRMEQVSGGAANLRSAPGLGTDVVITWAPERLLFGTGARATTAPSTAQGPIAGGLDTLSGPAARLDRRAVARVLADIPGPADSPPAQARASPALVAKRSLAESIGLSTTAGRSILVLYGLVHGLLALIDFEPGRPHQLAIGAFLAILLAAAVLMVHVNRPVQRPRMFLILGLCTVGAILMFSYMPAHGVGPFPHWHLGAITMIMLVLAFRGYLGWAWLGYVGLGMLALGWAVATEQAPLVAIILISRHAGTLLAGTLFVVGLRRTERTLAVLTANDMTRATWDATTVAAIDEREAELRRVNALARPTLSRLAQPIPLSAEERAQCLRIEAGLRDAIRGRALFLEPVITAVSAARHRGVEVTVLDDSGETPPAALPVLARTVADVLDSVDTGKITVRVLPSGRLHMATLVIESGTPRILSVDPTGALTV